MRKTLPLKYVLIGAILSLLIPGLFILSFNDYRKTNEELKKNFDFMVGQTVRNIVGAYQLVDLGYSVLADSLEDESIRAIESFKEVYFTSKGNIQKIDLNALKQKLGQNYDLYIINDKGVIIATTFTKDLGLDFKKVAPLFAVRLDEIRKMGRYVGDRISTETMTGGVRKYGYWGTPDQKYILEIGIKSDRFATFIKKIDIGLISDDLVKFNRQLKSVKIFDREGNISNNKTYKPSSVQLEQITGVYDSNAMRSFDNELEKTLTVYVKADIDENKGPSLGSRVIELVFSTKENVRYLKSLARVKFTTTVIILMLMVAIIVIISDWIATPINRITKGVGIIAQGNLDHQLEVDSFAEEVKDLKIGITSMVAGIKKNLDHISSLNTAFERFVPKDFLQHMGKKSILEVSLGDSKGIRMAVLFSDLRSFTALSEKLTPDENFRFLNRYMKCMAPAIQRNHGFIDKYIGDAMMALFAGNTIDALNAALEMDTKLKELNDELIAEGVQPISMGVGIHCGDLILGTVGEEHRMETTVISDTVNTASRLEGMTKMYGINLIISQQVYESLAENDRVMMRKIDRVIAKGKSEPTDIYEVFASNPEEVKNLKVQSRVQFEQGIILYYNDEVEKSLALFKDIFAQNSEDHVAKMWVGQCESIGVGQHAPRAKVLRGK